MPSTFPEKRSLLLRLAWDGAPALAGFTPPERVLFGLRSRVEKELSGDSRTKTSVQVKSSDPRRLGVDTVRLPPYLVFPRRRCRHGPWVCRARLASCVQARRATQDEPRRSSAGAPRRTQSSTENPTAAWLTPGRTCSLDFMGSQRQAAWRSLPGRNRKAPSSPPIPGAHRS